MNKTKIIATLGPASFAPEKLRELILAGTNVFRINFSHIDYAMLEELILNIRKIEQEEEAHISILGDLQGPKIRVGVVEGEGALLEDGAITTVTTEECISNHQRIFINYQPLAVEASPNEEFLIDDGKIKLKVIERISTTELKMQVIHGGMLKSKKGVNLPNTPISLPALTEKDRKDLDFILSNDFDWVALSFVRSVNDILELKRIIKDRGVDIGVMSKIEKPAALKQLEAIILESDAVMVARGDLGVEMPIEELPMIQRRIVKTCIAAAKPVVIATQMMESMTSAFLPTRAEASDVAHGVLEGADALMLSGETSVGAHPARVVDYMRKIISNVEQTETIYNRQLNIPNAEKTYLSDLICETAIQTAEKVKAKALITMTYSGYTTLRASSFRPKTPVFCFTANEKLLKRLPLFWGVQGFQFENMESTDACIQLSHEILVEKGYLHTGDVVINLASMPIQDRQRTNTLKISQI
jgi:pyruvate kinase